MDGLTAFVLYGIAALVSGIAAVFVASGKGVDRPDRPAAIAALALTGLWALAGAALGLDRVPVHLLEIARNLAWVYLVFRLFATDGRDETVRAVRPVAIAIAFVEFLQIVILVISQTPAVGVTASGFAFETSALLRMLVAIGALVLLHNLYAGAGESSRRLLAWNAGGLVLLWGYSLNFHTAAFLAGSSAPELVGLRALIVAVAVPVFALGYAWKGPELRFRPSRSVAFSILSLGLIAAYLIAMVALSQWAGSFSNDLARIAQLGFLLAAAGFSILWLPSKRMRGWLRVTALKHLFQHRFDYRSEWIRFTHTIGRSSDTGRPLPERAIQSLADITDSGGGLLLTPDADGVLALAAEWSWPLAAVPSVAMGTACALLMEREHIILDLDETRSGADFRGEAKLVPEWLLREPRAWAAVPLIHRERLVGVIVLARPPISRRLDWEDFDLLSIAGQHVASYLAEKSVQDALEESARFDEFNRRIAFVMHDIKNLSSQMSLLLRNAERHADNPEFRKDMLVTLRNSADKLNALLARLGRYGPPQNDVREEFDLATLAGTLKRRFSTQREIRVVPSGPCRVLGVREALEQALSHLVQNAIDASPDGEPVMVEIAGDGLRGRITIADRGPGMSAAYVRNELFRPFVSSKDGGFGIGACEARDLVRAMDGRLDVDSREGIGSRFTVSLPNANALRLRMAHRDPANPTESEAA